MPPKPKSTREEIAAAAFGIIKKDGLSALTARNLGKQLNASAGSIFTVFPSMEDVKLAARELALKEYKEYISDYREYTPAFKRIGMMMVSYGINEPELFKLLFMQEHRGETGFQSSLHDLGDVADVCIGLIEHDYSMTNEQAALLFEQLWVQAYGLGSMCAMGVCNLTEDEIGRRLGIAFAGHVMLIKSGKLNEVYADVHKNSDGIYHGTGIENLPFTENRSL